jgi:hypothetical protein
MLFKIYLPFFSQKLPDEPLLHWHLYLSSIEQLLFKGQGIFTHFPPFKQFINKQALSAIFSHLCPVTYKFGHLQINPFSDSRLFSQMPPFKQIPGKISQTPSSIGH